MIYVGGNQTGITPDSWGTYLGKSAIHQSLNSIVTDHIVAQAHLDDLMFGNRRCYSIEKVGERSESCRLDVLAYSKYG